MVKRQTLKGEARLAASSSGSSWRSRPGWRSADTGHEVPSVSGFAPCSSMIANQLQSGATRTYRFGFRLQLRSAAMRGHLRKIAAAFCSMKSIQPAGSQKTVHYRSFGEVSGGSLAPNRYV
jgi:hypothetical protein